MNSRLWDVVGETGREWLEDEVPRLAAALAYYTLLSITPLIVLAVALAGLVFGEEAARGQVTGELQRIVGLDGAEALETAIMNAGQPDKSVIGTLLGLGVLFFGASGVFAELQAAMNKIWEIVPGAGRGLWKTLRHRLFSFAMVMSVAFLLLVSLIVSAALAAAGRYFESALPGGELVWQLINGVISFAIVTALFAMLFKYVPDAEIAWRDVWIGAAVTALLFDLGKLLISLYLGKAGISSAYGAAGSVVVLVIWVYYSALILFLGAEFTQVQARRFGAAIRPSHAPASARGADGDRRGADPA